MVSATDTASTSFFFCLAHLMPEIPDVAVRPNFALPPRAFLEVTTYCSHLGWHSESIQNMLREFPELFRSVF